MWDDEVSLFDTIKFAKYEIIIIHRIIGWPRMVKRDPDDLISAISKNLKTPKAPVMRITLKRGGLWKPESPKAHSRASKIALKRELKK